MKYDLIIFDLDGTILNTLDDLTDACNAALTANGFSPRTREQVRLSIGSGISNLIRLSLPENADDSVRTRVLGDFKQYYFAHADVKTQPYPGIPELLKRLKAAGIHIAVNSNKIDPATRELCRAHFPSEIELAVGEREGVARKPSPAGAQLIMEHFHAVPERTLYVGDSNTDVLTAQNAGLDCAWVSWGFRQREELGVLSIPHAFDTVDALAAFLLRE